MNKAGFTTNFLPALIFLCFGSGLAHAVDGKELLRKVDANLQPESFESYRKLINIEPSGAKREYLLYTIKKGNDKIVSLFLSPASEKGRATLRLGDNMWLYIPNVGKPVRITSLQSVVGGVFNNADIMRLDYHAEYDVQNMAEEKTEFILDLKAKTGPARAGAVKPLSTGDNAHRSRRHAQPLQDRLNVHVLSLLSPSLFWPCGQGLLEKRGPGAARMPSPVRSRRGRTRTGGERASATRAPAW